MGLKKPHCFKNYLCGPALFGSRPSYSVCGLVLQVLFSNHTVQMDVSVFLPGTQGSLGIRRQLKLGFCCMESLASSTEHCQFSSSCPRVTLSIRTQCYWQLNKVSTQGCVTEKRRRVRGLFKSLGTAILLSNYRMWRREHEDLACSVWCWGWQQWPYLGTCQKCSLRPHLTWRFCVHICVCERLCAKGELFRRYGDAAIRSLEQI